MKPGFKEDSRHDQETQDLIAILLRFLAFLFNLGTQSINNIKSGLTIFR